MQNIDTKTLEEKPWVALLCLGDGGPVRFRTIGPFSLVELKAQIQAGRLHYSDYAWRAGYQKWVRIAHLEELSEPIVDILDQFEASRLVLPDPPRFQATREILEIESGPSAADWVDPDGVPPEASHRRL